MEADKDRNKIIEYIKKYYREFGKTPNMKEVTSKCNVNSRVFYELFENKEEAFKSAGVPYNDEARIRVEKANIARRSSPAMEVLSKKETIYLVDKNRLDEIRSRNTNNFGDEICYKLAILKNKILESNPQDKKEIDEAYYYACRYINSYLQHLVLLSSEYNECKLQKNVPPNMEKIYLVNRGFDFDDIEGSFEKLMKKISEEEMIRNKPRFNHKVIDYYNSY